MKRLLYKPLVLLFITTVCTATQCRKDSILSYSFTEKINLYPEQKEYRLGDTIWLEHLNTLNTLYDSRSNQYFSADTLNVEFAVLGSTVYNLPVDTSNIFCDFIFDGINAGPTFRRTFGCFNGGSFNFKVALVLNKTGTFSIEPYTNKMVASCNPQNPYSGNGFPNSYINYQFNIADANKDVYLGVTPARRAISKDAAYSLIENKQIFFFRVK
jgi:hypothetical protein